MKARYLSMSQEFQAGLGLDSGPIQGTETSGLTGKGAEIVASIFEWVK